jgi:hypothetical protein
MTSNSLHRASRFWSLLVSCCVTLASGQAQADDNPREITALALFDSGRQLMEQERVDEACPKFAESYRLDAALGTLLNLALCRERQGKTASAYFIYSEVRIQAAKLGDRERREVCEQRLEALAPRLSHLALTPPPPGPERPWVSLDGVRLENAALGGPLPLDPGKHQVRFGADGRRPRTLVVDVPGDAATVELKLSLEQLALEPASPPPPRSSSSPAAGPRPVTAVPWWRSAPTRNALFGASASALAVGSYFGVSALNAWSERDHHCPKARCDAQAVAASERARRLAVATDVAFGLALASAGVGVYLWMTHPERGAGVRVVGAVGPERAVVGAQGAF